MPLPGLALGYRVFRLPRRGYTADECQDASAGDPEHGRFAVADGAAESPHSALWARLLVEDFVRHGENLPNWADWLPALQRRWVEACGLAPNGDGPAGAGVPWYLEPGLNQGAFATFLGLVVEETAWYALAVGDSCLFQVRRGELVGAFPITRAADFGNAPWLVGSRTPGEVPHKNGARRQGECRPGDRFWLMTDALAQWFLQHVEGGGRPWLALDPLLHAVGGEDLSREAFTAWVEGLRAARQLRNDDVTLLAVSL
jgi:hypothetical protein